MPDFIGVEILNLPKVSSDTSAQFMLATGASGAMLVPKGQVTSQRKTLTTASNGTVTWTFDTPFSANPHIGALPLDNGANPISWKMTALSPTAVTFKAQRFNLLSLTLALLTAGTVNFFVDASGITLQAIAVPP